MKNISVLIKPASNLCNIKCDYCFYNTIANEREVISYGFMKKSILEEIVKRENSEKLNTLCEAYYDFFEYTSSRLIEVARTVINRRL